MIIKDGEGNWIDPRPLIPLPIKDAYYTGAPDVLTTMEAAKFFYGDEPPISSIRVVVKGVEERNKESQRKIEKVAQQIMELTGHNVEIMLGSSPTKVHIQLAGDTKEEVGVVEEGWQKKGVSWTIEKQVEETNKWLFYYLLIIIFLFLYTTVTHSLIKRSTEFATLRTIGWSRKKIMVILFIEVLFLSIAILLPLIISNMFRISNLELIHFIQMWLVSLVILGIGYLSGSRKSLFMSPREGLSGEGNSWNLRRGLAIRGLFSYVLHQLLRRPLRFGLLVLILAINIFMIVMFVSTQKSLSDFLFLSFLGEIIDLNLKHFQQAYLIIGIVLSITVVFFIYLINIMERHHEFYILRSIGWSNKKIISQLNLEATAIGFLGGFIGTVFAYTALTFLSSLWLPWWVASITLLSPILVLILFTSLVRVLIFRKLIFEKL